MATVRLVEAVSRLVRAFPPRNPLVIELNEALTEELSQKRADVTPHREITPPVTPQNLAGEITNSTPQDGRLCPVCEARKAAHKATMAKARAARKGKKAKP